LKKTSIIKENTSARGRLIQPGTSTIVGEFAPEKIISYPNGTIKIIPLSVEGTNDETINRKAASKRNSAENISFENVIKTNSINDSHNEKEKTHKESEKIFSLFENIIELLSGILLNTKISPELYRSILSHLEKADSSRKKELETLLNLQNKGEEIISPLMRQLMNRT
jgi:hypothetical protein